MYDKVNWKKGAFSTHYKLLSGNIEVGKLIDKPFSQKAQATYNNKTFNFETKGFFNQSTDIYNEQDGQKIGTISYNKWKTTADIEITGQAIYLWKARNSWKTKGVISLNDQKIVEYNGNSTKGEILIHDYNELLILTGLYVSNYYWQSMIAVFIAVFIPIWLANMN